MNKYFVWIKNTYGLPEAQIWFGMQTDGNGKARETLFIQELSKSEDGLSLSSLVLMYPFEAKS